MPPIAAVSEQEHNPPSALLEFRGINRYWDPVNLVFAAKLLPGEFYVTMQAEMITTVLGSCVAACVRDRVSGVGGMNHYMLPSESVDEHAESGRTNPATARYGVQAMERLIDTILKHGGRRENLEVKVFGGGKIVPGMADIGRRNIDFIRAHLHTSRLTLTAEDVGGLYARKVNYYPSTGRARVKQLRTLRNDAITQRERHYQRILREAQIDNAAAAFPSVPTGEASR